MSIGLGLLRLDPTSFWSMTPRELRAAFGAITERSHVEPPSRSELSQLIQKHPDR